MTKTARASSSLRLDWQTHILWQAIVRRDDGRALLLQYAHRGDGFGVLAIEGQADTIGTTKILEDHAHAIVIENARTEAAARKAALAFAKRWLDGIAIDKCTCETIGGVN